MNVKAKLFSPPPPDGPLQLVSGPLAIADLRLPEGKKKSPDVETTGLRYLDLISVIWAVKITIEF
jgi:hypothetical protein